MTDSAYDPATSSQQPDIARLESLLGQRQFAAVIAQGEAFVAAHPAMFTAHNIVGKAYAMLGRVSEAGDSFRAALAIAPDFAVGHNNLANILKMQGRVDEALASYRRAVEITPDDFTPNKNLALLLHEMGRVKEAAAAWRKVVELRPAFSLARAHMIHQLAHMCDWDALATEAGYFATLGVEGEFIPPFIMLAREDDPARHRIRAEKCASDQFGAISAVAFPDVPRPAIPVDRIRIGYFSADVHDHATMYLMVRMFELYDRDRFAVHVYSYGPDADDAMRGRVRAAVDVFHDVRKMSDRDVAALARSERIDIAVDLKGYTTDARLGILAWRPAPVQMSYLGYPGTTGAPFIDYLVADRFVVPVEQRHHYTEKLILLPDSYQANDDSRATLPPAPTRAEVGLPGQAFVFCCFNNSYKLTPEAFDIWMRLLDKVEGSVLWLLEANPSMEENLRRQAERRRIDPVRLVFAKPVSWAAHMARQRLADLFLDTFNYNAHTTCSDALWAGLPFLTLAGQGFAARVAASLLNAIGLPELITDSPERYEALALELATDPARLARVREKLRDNVRTMPLFDSAQFVRHMEVAYQQAYLRWAEGGEPEDLVVEAVRS